MALCSNLVTSHIHGLPKFHDVKRKQELERKAPPEQEKRNE